MKKNTQFIIAVAVALIILCTLFAFYSAVKHKASFEKAAGISATDSQYEESTAEGQLSTNPTVATTSQNATGSFITAERAKEIALNNAQLSASSVTFVKTNLEWENGVQVYEVEFWSGNIEYDYEINAYTGEIYSFDRDIENFSIPNTYYNTTQNNNSANSTKNQTANLITEERAKEIALNHANLSASSVTFIKVKLDWEGGTQVYDVEFRKGLTEYEYEINAQTGAVIKYERDFD